MPGDDEKLYTQAEVDAITKTRLDEQADRIFRKELERELVEITRRLDEANGLKKTMVTKTEFNAGMRRTEMFITSKLSDFAQMIQQQYITREETDDLAREAIKKFGIMAGLSPDVQAAITEEGRENIVRRDRADHRRKWWRTTRGRIIFAISLVGGVVEGTQLGLLIHDTIVHH